MPLRSPLASFELLVMLALIRLGEPAYGVPIARDIEEHGGKEVALGSVYATLERLEKKGLVASTLGDPSPERGGRAKRYFRVTARGVREIGNAQRAYTAVWRGVAKLKGDVA